MKMMKNKCQHKWPEIAKLMYKRKQEMQTLRPVWQAIKCPVERKSAFPAHWTPAPCDLIDNKTHQKLSSQVNVRMQTIEEFAHVCVCTIYMIHNIYIYYMIHNIYTYIYVFSYINRYLRISCMPQVWISGRAGFPTSIGPRWKTGRVETHAVEPRSLPSRLGPK